MDQIATIYKQLLKTYGPQGWWPLQGAYHPNDYHYPTPKQQFEIMVGTILTQNTTWKQAEKAVKQLGDSSPQRLRTMQNLPERIKPAGYFNQKANYLRELASFYLALKGTTPSREALLRVKGIGEETADSILLYAYHQPEFVVDAYTRRIFAHWKIKESTNREIKQAMPKNVQVYQEFHALLVQHGKRYYRKKPYKDPLR